MRGAVGYLEELTDDLIIDMVRLGYEDAKAEAERRGLPIPEPVDTSMDEIPEDYAAFGDTENTEDVPLERLPAGLLKDLIAGGDTEAARVLHARYPYLYDEAGKRIVYPE